MTDRDLMLAGLLVMALLAGLLYWLQQRLAHHQELAAGSASENRQAGRLPPPRHVRHAWLAAALALPIIVMIGYQAIGIIEWWIDIGSYWTIYPVMLESIRMWPWQGLLLYMAWRAEVPGKYRLGIRFGGLLCLSYLLAAMLAAVFSSWGAVVWMFSWHGDNLLLLQGRWLLISLVRDAHLLLFLVLAARVYRLRLASAMDPNVPGPVMTIRAILGFSVVIAVLMTLPGWLKHLQVLESFGLAVFDTQWLMTMGGLTVTALAVAALYPSRNRRWRWSVIVGTGIIVAGLNIVASWYLEYRVAFEEDTPVMGGSFYDQWTPAVMLLEVLAAIVGWLVIGWLLSQLGLRIQHYPVSGWPKREPEVSTVPNQVSP